MKLSSFNPEAAFNEAFTDELSQHPPGTEWTTSGRASKTFPDGEDKDWWMLHGPLMVERWVDWRAKTPWQTWISPDGTLGIELGLALHIDGEYVKLFIDNIFATDGNNGRLVVVDKKTGSRDPYGLLQLGMYKVAIEQMWPSVRVVGGTYWMGRRGEITGVETLDRFTPQYIGELVRRLKTIRDAGAFLPSVGPLCKTCKVGRYCAINNGRDSHLDPDFNLLKGVK